MEVIGFMIAMAEDSVGGGSWAQRGIFIPVPMSRLEPS
jgi:hypothetical protein